MPSQAASMHDERQLATSDLRWWHFTKQSAALELAESLAPEWKAQVWSLELDQCKGKRSYIVASIEAFWRRYRGLHPPARHYYELIRAGRPCHLYFDLEFCRAANPGSTRCGEQMVRTLCMEVRHALGARFGTKHSADCRIVDLDSSTPQKFSRHIIIRMRDAAFSSNVHVGSFVHELLSSFLARRANEPPIAAMFVAPPTSRAPSAAAQVSFVDTSVYSRNRCFRLCNAAWPFRLSTHSCSLSLLHA